MPAAIMLCGTICTGKSTYAKCLSEKGVVVFSADEWMLHFYGEEPDREAFDAKLVLCKEMICRQAEKFLLKGCDIALDFGFWKRAERSLVRSRFARLGVEVRLIYFSCTQGEWNRRIHVRNNKPSAHTYYITDEMKERFPLLLEPPTAEEDPVCIVDGAEVCSGI